MKREEAHESVHLIGFKYNMGVYSLKDMVEFVDKGYLTKKQFHWITSYSYEGVKEIRGWH